eukprot:TRINITY_DN6209_c0_g2_i1.p1 TRINITY_DN6209_c0_g2~~TRINITY_DN6209_c0_g2_i1.p1  ORF type:complete len:398 (+),score=89.44 TRINITY_DN6209_c0_g2_i1:469-1662(+)
MSPPTLRGSVGVVLSLSVIFAVAFVFRSGAELDSAGCSGSCAPGVATRLSVDPLPPPANVPVITDVPLGVVSDPNLCMSNSELFGGTVDDNLQKQVSYHPPKCNLTLYTDALWKDCLARYSFLFYGDSQLEGVVVDLMHRLHVRKTQENITSELTGKGVRAVVFQTTQTTNTSFFFMPIVTSVPWDKSVRVTFNVTRSRTALLESDVIVANTGAWDMGWGNCGPVRYYKALKAHILDLQQRKRKSAKIFMFGLRWIHRHRCPRTVDMCYTCNHPDKVKAFREAIQLAASCMGVHVIDTHHMSRLLPDNTGDGVHYRGKVHNLELDLLGNAVCRSPALNPAHLPCDEEAYFKKWSLNQQAYNDCDGKPGTCKLDKTYPHLTRYEGQAFAEELARSGHP